MRFVALRPYAATHMQLPRVTVAATTRVLSSLDILDFRLRVWERLRDLGKAVPELNEDDQVRVKSMHGKWGDTLRVLEESGPGRVLGGVPHVEKDKLIVRDLLKHSVSKNSLHGLKDLYKKIAKPLGLGETQVAAH
jgi:hypothetical protein